MRTLLKGGNVYRNHSFIVRDILIEDSAIIEIGKEIGAEGACLVDLDGKRVVPGFLDVHTHGGAGVDVNGADAKGLEEICRFQASQGTPYCSAISFPTDTSLPARLTIFL